MKKALYTLAILFGAMIGFNATAQEGGVVVGQENGPAISIDKDVHDYGTIEYAADGSCVFTVTNTGTTPLIISKCQGSCGCTVPEWTKDPIPPGATTQIVVKYDTKRAGPFYKSVKITSNAVNAPSKEIKIKGTVKAKPTAEAAPATN